MQETSEYVDFWNRVPVPRFIRFRHILVEGTSNHREQVLPTLGLKEGDRVVDIGCGFGDTAIELARLVGRSGAVLGVDCCDTFLDFGRREAAAAGVSNLTFVEADVLTHRFEPVHDACFSRFGTPVLRESGRRTAQHAHSAQTRRHDDDDRVARAGGQPVHEPAETGDPAVPPCSRGRR